MQIDRFGAVLMFAAVMTMGLVVGLTLGRGGTPAYGQLGVPGSTSGGGGGSYVVEEISSLSEKTKHHHHNGRTLAVVTPNGNLKLVRVLWERQRGEDDEFPENYAASGATYRIEMLEASASLAD